MRRKALLGFAAGMLFALPLAAWADSITPLTFSATIPVGGSVTVHKTVTITSTPGGFGDVYFLSDTTGSMGAVNAAVKAAAASVLTQVALAVPDVRFGVGEYKDNGDVYVFRLNQNMTASQAAAQAGINMWGASGGGDFEEADLYALQQAADTTTWRAGSSRILVWFGDASGHDPSGPTGVTEAQATARLLAQNIKVEAIDVGNLNLTGQATRIAAATGGSYTAGIDSAHIVDAIVAAITSGVVNYSTVGLDLSEVPAGQLTASSVPGSYVGVYDRSTDRTFEFDLTFNCLALGTADFNVYATVDGGRVATERDHIENVPEPAALLLLGSGLLGLGAYRRKKLPKA